MKIKQALLDQLNNYFILEFVSVYLLVMMLIIFTCKLLIDKNIQFDGVKKYPLGHYIYIFLTKYISLWRTSVNLWIYFILLSVIIFHLTIIYSLYHIVS